MHWRLKKKKNKKLRSANKDEYLKEKTSWVMPKGPPGLDLVSHNKSQS